MELKETIQIVSEIVLIVGGLFAAYKIITEMKQARIQRHMDLRWKQANAAREMLNQMLAATKANDATIMLDWSGREFSISDTKKATISFAEVRQGLRTDNVSFNEKEVYIRDCAYAFLFHVELIEQAIRNELIAFKDVKFPMEYYIAAMRKNNVYNAYNQFIKEYDYKNAERFLARFHAKLKTSKTMS